MLLSLMSCLTVDGTLESSAAVDPSSQPILGSLAALQSPMPRAQATCQRDQVRNGGVLYDSIQQAVDEAEAGATVTLCDGVFAESVFLYRDIALVSEHGPAFTFLVGDGSGSVLSILHASVQLVGLDISGGTGEPWRSPQGGMVSAGGGIYANDAPLLWLDHVRLHHNKANYGGGVFAAGVDRIVFDNVELTANWADNRGGGAGIVGGEFIASGLWIRMSESVDGGGLALDGVTAHLQDALFEDNTATHEGGGLTAVDSEISLSSCEFSNNTADFGGALALDQSALRTDSTTTMSQNLAKTSGGAIFLRDSELTAIGSALTENQGEHGGAIYLLGGWAVLDGATLERNDSYRGGGLYVTEAASLTLDGGTSVSENSAQDWAGGLAIFSNATLDVPNASISGNAAPYGGGVLAGDVICRWGRAAQVTGNMASVAGGGLYGTAVHFVGDGMLVSGNVAPQGAGILLEEGAEYVGAGDRITDNQAEYGAGLMLLRGATARLEDAEVNRNHATAQGGGAWIGATAGKLNCLDCDWGTGASDNGPEDIATQSATFAAPATFTCDRAGCRSN
jgi:predicted outer membrane repeat protein